MTSLRSIDPGLIVHWKRTMFGVNSGIVHGSFFLSFLFSFFSYSRRVTPGSIASVNIPAPATLESIPL